MSILREDALAYHAEGRPGKIQVVSTKPFKNQRDLSLAYTPGVAEPCREIAQNPEEVFTYTAKGNLVAVVSNGTAVLGLGDIGPSASKPVMEGKGILFKSLADIDVFDLELDAPDPEDVIRFCKLLEPTVGGINLEDIKAPDCFIIEERLQEELSIPVFHDDQHGTAIISGAALLNALELAEKKIEDVLIVFSGAGASALATAEHYVRLGANRENIMIADSKGVINQEREDLNPYKEKFRSGRKESTLTEALEDADVFVGLSKGGIVSKDMVKAMADRPIIFALANPDPEILPDDAKEARSDAIIATGRSDFPNQVNNVLGFPFIFRGALDVRARGINDEMKMAATRALADLTKERVPDTVMRAYALDRLEFGPEYLIPKPVDQRVLLKVAPAVAQAAIDSGVARTDLEEEEYTRSLEVHLGKTRNLMRSLALRASSDARKIVFPDGEDPRIQRAARILADDGIAVPILLGRPSRMKRTAAAKGLDLGDLRIINPNDSDRAEAYAHSLFEKRRRKGVTLSDAQAQITDPTVYGMMMVDQGEADAVVAGEASNYPDTIRPALQTIGLEESRNTICSIYVMMLPSGMFFFADCTVNIDPDAETLAEIAEITTRFVEYLGIEPRLALLSYSNFGSARHPGTVKVAQAVRLLQDRHHDLEVDGEMQADTAVVEDLLRDRYPFSRLKAGANVLIFPDLNSANIAYKLMMRLGGAEAIGPILVGMAKPVHLLQQDSDVNDIVDVAVIAAVDAQERSRSNP